MGRNLSEIIYYENFPLMEQQLSKGREFEGNMNCRRKNNQMITISCRIIPFCTTLKYVIVLIQIIFFANKILLFSINLALILIKSFIHLNLLLLIYKFSFNFY